MNVTNTVSRYFFRVIVFFSLIDTHAEGQVPFHDVGPEREASIVAVGDLMLGNRLIPVIQNRGEDYPFDSTASVIRYADIALANLEAPFTEGGTAYPKKFTFAVPPSYAGGPVHAGFDLVTLANNHILDFGVEGLDSTISTLREAGVLFCGAGMNRAEAAASAKIMRRGILFGFLSFSLTFPDSFWATSRRAGTASVPLPALEKIIREVQDSVDVVVVSFHWGGESLESPKPYQIQYAHSAIDAGADMVIGHHPHVLQGLEIYRGRLIAYSLGNFVFGSYSDKVQDGALLEAWFSGGRPVKAKIFPISVNNYQVQFQPKLLKSAERSRTIQYFNSLSKEWNGGNEIIDADGMLRIPSD